MSLLLLGTTKAVIMPLHQASRPAHVAETGPQALLKVLQNSGSRMLMLRVKPCRPEIATDEIQERNDYRECSNIKVLMSVH